MMHWPLSGFAFWSGVRVGVRRVRGSSHGRCRSEAVRLSFIQRSLIVISKPIFPLVVLHFKCAESTDVPDSISLPRQDPIEHSELVHVSFIAPETTNDFVSVDHGAQICSTVPTAAWAASTVTKLLLTNYSEREASISAGSSRVQWRLRLSRAHIPRHTHLWWKRHIQAHISFVRQLRAGAPSNRLLPGFCELHCWTTFQKPHETATAAVLPAAAWMRRIHLTWCYLL